MGGAQLLARIGAAALPTQPFPVEQMGAREFRADAAPAQVHDRVLVQALGRIAFRHQRPFALHRALASYADGVHWTRATPDEWITTAALSYAAVGIIVHVGIGLRWPFVPQLRQRRYPDRVS